jgi:excisionase family DNA binding protein
VPRTNAQPSSEPTAEVLTLTETAAFLRVPEKAVVELAEKGTLGGQRIGNEWRFHKRAVVDWLRFGSQLPPLVHQQWEALFRALLQVERPTAAPPRGSKEAVLKHFGVFKDDGDLEEQLATLRKYREAAGE